MVLYPFQGGFPLYLDTFYSCLPFLYLLALLHSSTTVLASQDANQELSNVTSIRKIEMHVKNVDMLNIQTLEFYTGQY